jgi:hypothetical protein
VVRKRRASAPCFIGFMAGVRGNAMLVVVAMLVGGGGVEVLWLLDSGVNGGVPIRLYKHF